MDKLQKLLRRKNRPLPDKYLDEKLFHLLIYYGLIMIVFFIVGVFLGVTTLRIDFNYIYFVLYFMIIYISIRFLFTICMDIFHYGFRNILLYQLFKKYQKLYFKMYVNLGIVLIIMGIFYSMCSIFILYIAFNDFGYGLLYMGIIYIPIVVVLRISINYMIDTLDKIALHQIVERRAIGDTTKIKISDPIFHQIGDMVDKLYSSVADTMQEKLNAEKLKTELITNVTHDIKTPLTSIINYVDLLKNEVDDSEKERYISILEYNSKRLKALILDLIYASKTGTGNIDLQMELIEVNELILQVYGQFDREFNEKNLEFIFKSQRKNILMLTDGSQFSRVIENLFSNCVKYSLENTRIYGTTQFKDGKIIIQIKNFSKDKLNISAQELTSQFVRGERSRHEEGSGLGLYIATNIIELLGGDFHIDINGDLFIANIEFKVKIQNKK